MVLLYWSTIKPQGVSNLAAIRFSVPVRISRIRLFPTGAIPFEQCPDIVAHSEPEAFHLDVYFNAIDSRPAEPKDKQRAANALIPTSIAYAGGLVDFTVDLGTECSTRLMLVCGQFDVLTLAVYGEVVSADKLVAGAAILSSSPPSYNNEPHRLSAAVDVGNMNDPTTVARQLLELMPDSPPLPLAIRLIFCLKPAEEDWDNPEFPYLYADLEAAMQATDLEECLAYLVKPIHEDTPQAELEQFSEVVISLLSQSHPNQAFDLARLLNLCACGGPSLVSAICRRLEGMEVFVADTLDTDTLLQLLSAAANPCVSKFLRNPFFMRQLHELQNAIAVEPELRVIARHLATRTQSWAMFEDSLTNTQADFKSCGHMLKDIGREEQALANWLESMIMQDDIADRLRANPVLTKACPDLSSRHALSVSHDDYIVFVRSFLGVSSVMAVLAWADSVGNDECRERALAVLRLWQCVDGYSQIVSHLFLIRQLARRLEWITADKDPPRKSGILGEQILLELANSPQMLLNDDLVGAVLALKPPLSVISEQERLAMRKAALVVDDGLPAAIDELMFSGDHPLSLRRLRTLRVSVAIIQRELEKDGGDWDAMSTSWTEHSTSLGTRLVEVLQGFSGDLNFLFSLSSPSAMNHDIAHNLFTLSEELLQVIVSWLSLTKLTIRTLQTFTLAVISVFACADMGDMQYSRGGVAYVAAHSVRVTCGHVLAAISQPNNVVEGGKLCADIILRTLLGAFDAHARDPAHHISQIFILIDRLLPIPSSDMDIRPPFWLSDILPTMLPELLTFLHRLDTEYQADLIRRLGALDQGVTAISEWIISQELVSLRQNLFQLKTEEVQTGPSLLTIARVHVAISLRLLQGLAKAASKDSWLLRSLLADESSGILAECLMLLCEENMSSSALHPLVQDLYRQWDTIKSESLQYAVITSLLRTAWMDKLQTPLHSFNVVERFKELSPSMLDEQSLYREIGRVLHFSSSSSLQADDAKLALDLMIWLYEQSVPLRESTSAAFTRLCDGMSNVLAEDKRTILNDMRSKLLVDDAESMSAPLVELPNTFDSLGDLLNPTALATPSTPKKKSPTPEIFGPMLSPATAILRSPAATGLTKTYNANDFRDLRQAPSARQNTSRLPSMHVDVGINNSST